jgi:hypothetical protein
LSYLYINLEKDRPLSKGIEWKEYRFSPCVCENLAKKGELTSFCKQLLALLDFLSIFYIYLSMYGKLTGGIL